MVSRRWTGLGDCLVSLLAAWRFARGTGRTLVADWRFSPYSRSSRTNVFALLFEPPALLGGVPFLGDDRVNDLTLTGPFHPASWNAVSLHRPPSRAALDEAADREAAVTLIRSGRDVAMPVVVFDGCLSDAIPSREVCRQVLGELRPLAPIACSVEAFSAEHFSGRPVVAVHVRHGNGGNIMSHARFWTSPVAALGRIVEATTGAVRGGLQATRGVEPVVFLCTDSQPVEHALRGALSRVVTRPKVFRPQGDGELHLGQWAFGSRDDTAVEMLLLARSDVLVQFPPGSFFSFWGAVMKRSSPPPACGPIGRAPSGLGPAVY